MPHIANLPWLQTYVIILALLFTIAAIISFANPSPRNNSITVKNNSGLTCWNW